MSAFRHVVLYDGDCGFCHASVQWLLRLDSRGGFAYAALQGETAERLRTAHPELPHDLDSVVLVESFGRPAERVWWRSHAVFRICSLLGGVYALPGLLRFLPRRLTDYLYNQLARVRHRLMPAPESCQLPSEAQAARFLPRN